MDLLVKLYGLKDPQPPPEGISIRRAFAAEKRLVGQWVLKHFGERWASECDIAFMRQPVACFLATNDFDIMGFATYDTTARGIFGPTGVDVEARHKGVGRALLGAALHDMASKGYAYAIVGCTTSPASIEFYRHEVNAVEIPGSSPGFYEGLLKPHS